MNNIGKFFKINITIKSYNPSGEEESIEISKVPHKNLNLKYMIHLIAEFINDIK